MNTTQDLIETLSGRLQPVRPSRPPLSRAAAFVLACLLLVAAAAWLTQAWPLMLARLTDSRFAVELAATTLTGIAGIAAAFMLAVPDRRREWAVLPLPFLAIWLLSSGYGCYRSWLVTGTNGLTLGPSADCFMFIVGFSIPLSAGLWLALKRSAAWLDPVRTTACAGIGVAALAAAALQFWHPFDVTVADLAAHAAAVAVVCTAVIATARRSFPLGHCRATRPNG
ncbi:MAG TPA: NrsF family protein [Micropepsaceae bacterium]|nr:NrsF family protein [Micropepsaceae bacterium]